MSVIRLGAAALLSVLVSGCALRTIDGCRRCPAPQMSELWTEPDAGRDLFWGPEESKPRRIRMRSTDSWPDVTGRSPGYDVRDAQGRLWSVKVGPEAQSEVVVSRLLWAAGSTSSRPPTTFRAGRSSGHPIPIHSRQVGSVWRPRARPESTTGRGAVIRSSAPRRCAASLC